MNLRSVKKITVLCLILGLGVYGYVQMRPFLSGPRVAITSITPLSSHTESVVVRGTAQHITHLTINDRPLFTDTEGAFEETLLLLPGYNFLTLEAADRFGRTTQVGRQLYME